MENQEKKSILLAWVLNIAPGLRLIYVGKKWPGVLLLILGGIFLIFCLTGIGATSRFAFISADFFNRLLFHQLYTLQNTTNHLLLLIK